MVVEELHHLRGELKLILRFVPVVDEFGLEDDCRLALAGGEADPRYTFFVGGGQVVLRPLAAERTRRRFSWDWFFFGRIFCIIGAKAHTQSRQGIPFESLTGATRVVCPALPPPT